MTLPRVSAVVLAYGAEPLLGDALEALLGSQDVDVDVVLVDNGELTGVVQRFADRQDVTVVTPPENLGYAGGCNAGVARATGEYLALVNGDAVVDAHALRRLVDVAAQEGVGIASGSIRLADAPATMNSAGNPVHFSGLSWAGGYGEPASAHAVQRDVTSASGAGLVLSRHVWDHVGGFASEYFAYLEDTELSLRCWQLGLRVVYVPDAVVVHRYEFSRNDRKAYLLERNRLVLLATLFERRTLLRLLPALLLVEAAMLALSLVQGWAGAKLRGWCWVLRHLRWVRSRRRQLQRRRTVPDAVVLARLTDRLDMANVGRPPGLALLDAVLRWWWHRVVLRPSP
ncbi:MAG: hypothetical protein JWO60_902 [Frankiales bacterium]|nr:hypothetical protein [Frankiales bacterium]